MNMDDLVSAHNDENYIPSDKTIICSVCGDVSLEYGYCDIKEISFCEKCWFEHIKTCNECLNKNNQKSDDSIDDD